MELQQQTVGIPRGALRTTIVTGVTFGGAALGAGIAALIKGAGVETPVDAAVADGFLFVVAVAVLSVAHVVASDARARATVFAPVATAAQVVGDAGSAPLIPPTPLLPTALTTLAAPMAVRMPGDARRWTAFAAGTSAGATLLLLGCPGEPPQWRRTVDVVLADPPLPEAPAAGALHVAG